MAIDARPGTVRKISLPQSLLRCLGSDRLTANRAGVMWHAVKGGLVILVVLALAACSSGSATGPSTTSATTTASATASSSVPQELRDVRYCEVIPSVQSGSTVTSYVYNTLGLNDCPPGRWNALTEDKVNKEFGSQSAKLNGPRHWVIDGLMASGSTTSGKTFTFGGIEMQLRATLQTSVGTPTVGEQFYVPNQVMRSTVFIYDAGKPIFELTAPNGDVYVMQSYAQIVDKTLTYNQLPSLASKLQLPTGWTYSTKTLQQDLKLDTTSTGVAYVVNDNLEDSYQRM
jgi:hypothetical protein